MKTIKAEQLAVGMNAVEQDGGLLEVTSVEIKGRFVLFIAKSMKSMMATGIVGKVRVGSLVKVAG